MYGIFDSHAHYDDEAFREDRDALLQKSVGGATAVCVASAPGKRSRQYRSKQQRCNATDLPLLAAAAANLNSLFHHLYPPYTHFALQSKQLCKNATLRINKVYRQRKKQRHTKSLSTPASLLL